LALAAPTGDFHPTTLLNTVDVLLQQFDRVLLQIHPAMELSAPDLRRFLLQGESDKSHAPAIAGVELTVRGWIGTEVARPDRDGLVVIPAMEPPDDSALKSGVLPSTSVAGSSLGSAARHLARLRVGVAFGAGGAKGYGHVGVIRVLNRLQLPIDYVAGTSIGSCIATMCAEGRGVEEMVELLDQFAGSLWRPTIPRISLLSSKRLKLNFQRMVGDVCIEDVGIPLAIVAADILTQQEVVFREGLLWPALLASVSIPGIYPPQRMGPHVLVDGGLVNPVPASVVDEMGADLVIAVKLSRHSLPPPVYVTSGPTIPGGPPMFQTMIRAFGTVEGRVNTATAAAATIQIDLDFNDFPDPSVRHFKEGRQFVELGEKRAEEAMTRLATTFPWLQTMA
jgi:NTE family protein